jgi:hypothetical protein
VPDFVAFQRQQRARDDDDKILGPPLPQIEPRPFGRKQGRIEKRDGAQGSLRVLGQQSRLSQAPFGNVIVRVNMEAVHQLMQPALDILVQIVKQAHPGAGKQERLCQFEQSDDA